MSDEIMRVSPEPVGERVGNSLMMNAEFEQSLEAKRLSVLDRVHVTPDPGGTEFSESLEIQKTRDVTKQTQGLKDSC